MLAIASVQSVHWSLTYRDRGQARSYKGSYPNHGWRQAPACAMLMASARWTAIMNSQTPSLHTDRLILRELTPHDTPSLARILGDAEVMRHSVRGVLCEQSTGEFIHRCCQSYRQHGFGPWAVVEKSTSTLAGFCGLNAERVDDVDEIEIGYRLAPAFWGRGLGTEAARSAIAHGFEQIQLTSLIAIVQPANVASVNVIQKLGFSGFIHSQYHRHGVRIYRMNAQQWSSGSAVRGGEAALRG